MTDLEAKNMHQQDAIAAPELDERAARDTYERLAGEFSRVYAETRDIATTFALLDVRCPRQLVWRSIPNLPTQALAIAAALFYIRRPSRLLEPGRHRDICSARWIAAWLLRRQRWSLPKIAAFLNVDHSTIVHGLRRIAESPELRAIAIEAETRLDASVPVVVRAAPPTNDTGPANDTVADATVPKVA